MSVEKSRWKAGSRLAIRKIQNPEVHCRVHQNASWAIWICLFIRSILILSWHLRHLYRNILMRRMICHMLVARDVTVRHNYSAHCINKAVPLQARRGPEGSRKLRFSDFVTTAQDGGKVVSLTHRPPLPPRNARGSHFFQRLSRPQGHSVIGRILCQWKIPMTPAGVEPATFRFVAQHLNHWATAVSINFILLKRIQKKTP